MAFDLNFIFILIAGIMNGSFVVPAKKMCANNNEHIWTWHSIIGLIIIPWVIVLVLSPQEFMDFFRLSPSVFVLIIFGGIVFGIGQVCFSYAIEFTGVALSFATNLGVGVVIGSLFTIAYQHLFFSFRGALVTMAVFLVLLGLALYYFSSKNKDETANLVQKKHSTGWLLAIVAGITSGFQNIVFILTHAHQQKLFQTLGAFWVWPIFLTFASIPMIMGFTYKMHKKNTDVTLGKDVIDLQGWLKIILMGLLFTGSLVLYSKGAERLSQQQIIIAWPAFMVTIILITQLWGSFFGEASRAKGSTSYLKWASIALMVVAIVILSLELQ